MLDQKDLQAIAQMMKDELAPVNGRLDQMQEDISDLRTTVTGLQEDISDLRTTVTGLQEDVSEMRTTVTRVAITQENIVLPQLKALAEGHETLLNMLARKERVEALEDDVSLLKTASKTLSLRLTELENARA